MKDITMNSTTVEVLDYIRERLHQQKFIGKWYDENGEIVASTDLSVVKNWFDACLYTEIMEKITNYKWAAWANNIDDELVHCSSCGESSDHKYLVCPKCGKMMVNPYD